MTNLFPPPGNYALPLSKGQDLVVDFQNVNSSGATVNWPGGSTVTLTIDTTIPITTLATISTYHAVCYIAAATVNPVAEGIEWSCVANVPGGLGTPSTVNVVLVNGKTDRSDGGA